LVLQQSTCLIKKLIFSTLSIRNHGLSVLSKHFGNCKLKGVHSLDPNKADTILSLKGNVLLMEWNLNLKITNLKLFWKICGDKSYKPVPCSFLCWKRLIDKTHCSFEITWFRKGFYPFSLTLNKFRARYTVGRNMFWSRGDDRKQIFLVIV